MALTKDIKLPDEVSARAAERSPSKPAFEIDWTDPATLEDSTLLDFIVGQYRAGKVRRLQWEREAAEQLAWARGNQHLIWDAERRDLTSESFENLPLEYRDPVHLNKIKGVVLQAMALSVGQPMTWDVQAQTRDPDDLSAARLGTKLMQYYWNTGDTSFATRFYDIMWMMYCTGIVLLKPIWDPMRGSIDRFSEDLLDEGETEEAKKQRGLLKGKFKAWVKKLSPAAAAKVDESGGTLDWPGGDVYLDWANGFDITEPVNVRNVEESGWMIHSRFRPVEYVKERYGEAADDVQPDTNSEQYEYRRFEAYGNWNAYTGKRSSESPSDEVMVHELWRPRSGSAPKGVLAVVANQIVLKKGPHPYMHGRLPFIRLTEMPEPEHFRPGCTVRDLMPLQRARNRQRSYMHGHLKMTIDPRILNEKGSGLPDDAFVSGAKVIPVKDGGILKVKAWENPQIPPYMLELDAANLRDMEDVAGIHKSTQGQREGAGQSGKHAAMMQQADTRRQSIPRQIIEKGFAKAGSQMLWLIWEFVSEERMIGVPGSRGKFDVVKFKGKDLTSLLQPGRTVAPLENNVIVKLGREPDMERALNMIDSLATGGWLDPQKESDKQLVYRWIGEEVPSEMDEGMYHRTNAAEENEAVLERKDMTVAMGDDHNIHTDMHLRFTTSPEFKAAIKKRPEVDARMRHHIRVHMYEKADRAFREQAVAKRVQAELVKEYGLVPSSGGAAGQGGAPGGPQATPGPPGQPGRPQPRPAGPPGGPV